ncbi:MAG: cyclodeaminase/cyclohydrolase family protein [Candidatus Omnitrophota bacterium]
MGNFKNFTLSKFLDVLSQKTPVPGGGAAAALCAANAVALISMTARYSLGKGKPTSVEKKITQVLKKSEELRTRFLELVDLDAEAYLNVVVSRQGTAQEQRQAKREARRVPAEIAKLCNQALNLTPILVTEGSKYLLSDIEVAVELLFASYKSAMINVKINQ